MSAKYKNIKELRNQHNILLISESRDRRINNIVDDEDEEDDFEEHL
jgi:hypothetical protein